MKPVRALAAFAVLVSFTFGARAQDDDLKTLLKRCEESRNPSEEAQLAQRAAEIAPNEWICFHYLGSAQYRLHLWEADLASQTKALEVFKAGKSTISTAPGSEASILTTRAVAYLGLGELAKGRKDIEAALAINPKDPFVWGVLGHYLSNAGDFDKALEAFTNSDKFDDGSVYAKLPEVNHFEIGQVLRLKGDSERARAEFEKIQDMSWWGKMAGQIGLALIAALPEDPKLRDLQKAREILDAAIAGHEHEKESVNAQGCLLVLEGDPEAAIAVFAEMGGAGLKAEVVFHHGLAHLRVGARDRAVELLTRAADMRPAYKKRIETDPEFAPVRALILAAVAELAKRDAGDRIAIKSELDTAPVQLACAAGLARTFRFKTATETIQNLAKGLRSEALKAVVEARLATARDESAVFDKVVSAIEKRQLKDLSLPGKDGDFKVLSADPENVELALGTGRAKGAWAIVPFEAFFELAKHLPPSEAEWFTLGLLAFEFDRPLLGEEAFCQCLAKGKTFKARIDEAVAARRGVAVPQGGYVPSGNRLVTAEDRDNAKKGLVLFRGQWVSKEDKPHLEKNHAKVEGKWVPLTEDQLQARGFVKFDGEWRTKEEVARRRGEWANAWELETEHYQLRSNKSEAFLKKLGLALEDAYKAYAQFFGKTPSGKKMKGFAFAKFDDYKAYCDKVKHPENYNATGFAPCEENTFCGYDKLGDDGSFIATMVHEGAHMFHQLSFPNAHPPSWVAEGMATYFEGFTFENGGHLRWNHISRERHLAVKEAIRRGQIFPIADFLGADAGKLIEKDPSRALTFYAEAWAVFYFFNETLDARYRDGFRDFMDRLDKGGSPDLKETLGPAFEGLQGAFSKFVQEM